MILSRNKDKLKAIYFVHWTVVFSLLIQRTVGIVICIYYEYDSPFWWRPQTMLEANEPNKSAVHSTASWGCWWAESRVDEHPDVPLVLVSRHVRLAIKGDVSLQQTRPVRLYLRIHPGVNKSARLWTNRQELTQVPNSEWIRVPRTDTNLTELERIKCQKVLNTCEEVTQSFVWLWAWRFINSQAEGERIKPPPPHLHSAPNPVLPHLLEPEWNVNSCLLSDEMYYFASSPLKLMAL